MSLFNIFNIAGTAMQAQTVRLNVTASNMANANSESSSVNRTYRARHPVFAVQQLGFGKVAFQQAMDSANLGVRVAGIVESQAPLRKEYRPDSPNADSEGYVNLPNVNPIEEMANMISASRSYQSNVEVFNTSKQLLLRTLALGD